VRAPARAQIAKPVIAKPRAWRMSSGDVAQMVLVAVAARQQDLLLSVLEFLQVGMGLSKQKRSG
jgi:hypothetical protein